MNFEYAPVSTIVFVLTIGFSLYALYKDQSLLQKWVLHPYSMVRENKWYTLITSGLLHGDMMHLMFNMITFFFFAFQLESIVGGLNFAIIYFGSMALSDVSTIIKQKDNPGYGALGASGAISGVLFSFILFEPTRSIYMMFIPIPIPAPVFAIFYLIYCYYAARNSQDFINHDAHLWGALAGIVITIALIPQVVPYFINEIGHVF